MPPHLIYMLDPEFRERYYGSERSEELRWHYKGDQMVCNDCNGEVWALEDGYICRACGRQRDEA